MSQESALTPAEIAAVREMLDRQQITRAIYDYARGMDRADWALFKSVFWPDGVFDGGPAEGKVWETADDLFAAVVAHQFATSQHLFANVLIDIQGPRAYSESYAIVYHQTYPTRESNEIMVGVRRLQQIQGRADISYDYVMGLRYVDVWEKRGGAWKILRRRLVLDWTQVQPLSHPSGGGIMDHLRWAGCRGTQDPSYHR